MNTEIGVKNTGLGTNVPSSRQLLWLFLLVPPIFGGALFTKVLFRWPWKGQEALVGINLVEATFSIMFQELYISMYVMAISPFIAYALIIDEKGLLTKLMREGKANLSERFLLIALAIPFLCAVLFAFLPIVFCLACIFVLWMGAGQLADILALLPGYGDEALKQALWLVNLCMLNGVLGMLFAWMAINSRRKWWLDLKQKSLNLACLGIFLVMYWQFSKHYGASSTDLLDIYYYDPKVPMGEVASSLSFLICSAIVVGFLSMRSMNLSLRDTGQVALIKLCGDGFIEEKRELAFKVACCMVALFTVLSFVYLYFLGDSYA